MTSQIFNGDSLEVLKTLPDNSIDSVISDPPYGYSFMGKDWDKAVPSVEIWKECLRVLKPGAFMCVMSAPRSDVQCAMISRLQEAGFRLDFTPIYWTYASGFPKAGNIGKLVDKRLGAEREVTGVKIAPNGTEYPRGYEIRDTPTPFSRSNGLQTAPATDQAKALDGSYAGFQPKPAVEVIIVAMKPLSEKTYVDQALKNGKGITWLDDCRVPTGDGKPAWNYPTGPKGRTGKGTWNESNSGFKAIDTEYTAPASGRFPANLLVSDDVLNDGRVRTSGGGDKSNKKPKSLTSQVPANPNAGVFNVDSGSYSRYFDLDKWAQAHLTEQQMKTFPFAIFPKASKSEKNKGLEHTQLPEKKSGGMEARNRESGKGQFEGPTPIAKNHHPTCKPLKLMSYLITLFSREGDTVLDPFVGSGTTVVAAKQLNRIGIGIEREPEYAEIATARLDAVETEKQTELV